MVMGSNIQRFVVIKKAAMLNTDYHSSLTVIAIALDSEALRPRLSTGLPVLIRDFSRILIFNTNIILLCFLYYYFINLSIDFFVKNIFLTIFLYFS